MGVSYPPELHPHGGVESWPFVVVVPHALNDAQDGRRLRVGCPDAFLDFVEDALAFILAADKVVRRADDAVRGALHIVRDQHLLATPSRGFIEGAQIAQIRLRLAEAPLPVPVGSVEIGEADAAGASLVQLEQGLLDDLALCLPEEGEGLRYAADDFVCVIEGELPRHRSFAAGPQHALLRELRARDHPMCEGTDLVPTRKGLQKKGAVLQEELDTLVIIGHQPMQHVHLHDLGDLRGAEDIPGVPSRPMICLFEQSGLRVEDELLNASHQQHGILKTEAPLVPFCRLEEGRKVFAQDLSCARLRNVRRLSSGLEPPDQETLGLDEVPVGHVTEHPPLNPLIRLGHGSPNWQELLLDLDQALGFNATTAAHHCIESFPEVIAAELRSVTIEREEFLRTSARTVQKGEADCQNGRSHAAPHECLVGG
mmetsp:Transcript_8105/g.17656  ORF Transcript_8105/g.17656 Transcript_8105/m.17656 type:complete len:426 (+) Transcript_8105:347-1624(+)